MRRLSLIALLLFTITELTDAAVGDGADKIEDAYGPLVSRHLRDDGRVDIVYHKDRYLYRVTFERSVSVAEEYSRVDGAKLSEKEIAKFLKMNAKRQTTSSRGDGTLKVELVRKQ